MKYIFQLREKAGLGMPSTKCIIIIILNTCHVSQESNRVSTDPHHPARQGLSVLFFQVGYSGSKRVPPPLSIPGQSRCPCDHSGSAQAASTLNFRGLYPVHDSLKWNVGHITHRMALEL